MVVIGILTNVDDGKRKAIDNKRESGWVENFQKYSALDPGHHQRKKTDDNSRLQGAKTKSKPEAITMNVGGHRCDEDISQHDLVMLGLYRLDEKQKKVYADFVNMLKDFDSFDVVWKFYACAFFRRKVIFI